MVRTHQENRHDRISWTKDWAANGMPRQGVRAMKKTQGKKMEGKKIRTRRSDFFAPDFLPPIFLPGKA
jgi:hypothetical protein